MIVICIRSKLITLLDGSLTDHVNCFTYKSAFVFLRVDLFAVVEMLGVFEPDLMDDVLVWELETSVGGHEPVDIVVLSEVVLGNGHSKTRFETFFARVWVFERNHKLIVLSMHKKRLILKILLALTLIYVDQIVVLLIFEISLNKMCSLRICHSNLLGVSNESLLNMNLKTIKMAV